jgi:hypothetical protein
MIVQHSHVNTRFAITEEIQNGYIISLSPLTAHLIFSCHLGACFCFQDEMQMFRCCVCAAAKLPPYCSTPTTSPQKFHLDIGRCTAHIYMYPMLKTAATSQCSLAFMNYKLPRYCSEAFAAGCASRSLRPETRSEAIRRQRSTTGASESSSAYSR